MTKIPREHEAARRLEESFRRLGEERARERRSAPGTRATRGLVGALGLVAVVAAAATGSKVFLADGGAIDPAPGGIPHGLSHSPADRRLAEAKAGDPREPIRWGMRLYTSASGDACVVLGRLVDGRLGLVQSGRFKRLPAGATGVCSDLTKMHVLVTLRRYGDVVIPGGRTVLYGVTDRTIRSLTIRSLPARRQPVPIAADGTFIAVLDGPNKLRNAQLIIDGVSGRTKRALGG